MFDVGFAELFLLALIGLLVLGPERLPGVARTVGGYVRKARTSWISLRNTIEAELSEADISAPIKQTSEELKKIGEDLADMPDFIAGKRSSVKTETSQTGDPEVQAETRAEPVQKPGNGDDRND